LQLRGSRDNQSNEIDFANLVIDKIYRFSGQNDAADEAILYSISNLKTDSRLFVNGYGIYTDEEASTIIEKISLNTLIMRITSRHSTISRLAFFCGLK
jgi:hypothetical protein